MNSLGISFVARHRRLYASTPTSRSEASLVGHPSPDRRPRARRFDELWAAGGIPRRFLTYHELLILTGGVEADVG